jgi:hypothetical protein
MRTPSGDKRGRGDVSPTMRIWQGTTPDGYALLVERDCHGQWVVTVASVSRSRNDSLEAALVEAGGGSVPHAWAAKVATLVAAQAAAETLSEPTVHSSRTGEA